MKLLRFFPLLLLFADSCIERLDIPEPASEPRLVVDGLVTNEAGPYTIRLFRSYDIDSEINYPDPVEGATVAIEDDLGVRETLTETHPGVYETSVGGMQGEVGRSYKLHIATADEHVYESGFQRLNPSGELTDLYFEFVPNAINLDDLTKLHDVFRIYVNATGDAGGSNLFRWRWHSIFEARTFPEYRTKSIIIGEESVVVPDPLPCSGFTVSEDYQLVPVSECICCTCWVTEYSQTAQVSNNRVMSEANFERVQVAELPVEPEKFINRFYIHVDQMSLNEDAYAFWRNVQIQQSSAQNIFQPNVIRIPGNVRSVSHPGEEVSGVFAAAGITSKSVFINRTDVPIVLHADSVYRDCRAVYPKSTNIKPPFW